MIFTITITQEHIDAGIPEDCNKCPGALAIMEKTRPGVYVEVYSDDIQFWEENPEYPFSPRFLGLAETPRCLDDFMHRFDSQQWNVEPTTFGLDIPAEVAIS